MGDVKSFIYVDKPVTFELLEDNKERLVHLYYDLASLHHSYFYT